MMQAEKLTVSVLIPTFNRSALLVDALNSILSQSRSPDEVIVVNDGSTDDTLEKLKQFGTRIRVIDRPNGGKSAALNFALTQVTTDAVWIFDDDDLAAPDALETLTGLLEANSDADLAYGRHERFTHNTSGKMRFLGTGHWVECDASDFLLETMCDMFVHQPGMLVRKSLYDRVGAFNETLPRSMDYEMLLRLARAGKVVSTNRVVFYQRMHEGRRGTCELAIANGDRKSHWIKHDKDIFTRLYAEARLEEFARPTARTSEFSRNRAYLFSRGSVMARKKLWKLAVGDYSVAAALSDQPLSQAEKTSIRYAMASKYGVAELERDDEFLTLLHTLVEQQTLGACIVSQLSAGLNWRFRKQLQAGKLASAAKLAEIKFKMGMMVLSARVRHLIFTCRGALRPFMEHD